MARLHSFDPKQPSYPTKQYWVVCVSSIVASGYQVLIHHYELPIAHPCCSSSQRPFRSHNITPMLALWVPHAACPTAIHLPAAARWHTRVVHAAAVQLPQCPMYPASRFFTASPVLDHRPTSCAGEKTRWCKPPKHNTNTTLTPPLSVSSCALLPASLLWHMRCKSGKCSPAPSRHLATSRHATPRHASPHPS